jgi:hypothetical protein
MERAVLKTNRPEKTSLRCRYQLEGRARSVNGCKMPWAGVALRACRRGGGDRQLQYQLRLGRVLQPQNLVRHRAAAAHGGVHLLTSRILFDAISSDGSEPGLGCRNSQRLGLAKAHIQPHLAIGDVAARQAAAPHQREELGSYRRLRTPQKRGPVRRRADLQIRNFGRATPPFVTRPAALSDVN